MEDNEKRTSKSKSRRKQLQGVGSAKDSLDQILSELLIYSDNMDARTWNNAARKRNSRIDREGIPGTVLGALSATHLSGDVLRNEFYAAAYLFQTMDSQRCWTPNATSDSEDSKDTRARLLDGIALLFARSKNLTSGTSDRCESPAVANVTATACSEVHDHDEQRLITIYIAKNHGPQDFDGISDDLFLKDLEVWYNDTDLATVVSMVDTITSDSRNANMWASMHKFWFRRHRYYVEEIRDTHKKLVRDLQMDIMHSQPDAKILEPTITLGDQTPGDIEAIKHDWNHAKKLLGWLLDRGVAIEDDKILKEFVDQICTSDEDQWKGSYKKYPSVTNNDKRHDLFRKLIKHFKMLRTLRSVWKALVQFKRDPRFSGVKIQFRFLPSPPKTIDPIGHQNLIKTMNNWLAKQNPPSNLKSASESSNPIVKGISQSIKSLKTHKGIGQRSFHCELQLLQVEALYTKSGEPCGEKNPDKECIWRYIGCSKLSCFMCWELLKAVGFTTKNTHGKLSCGCAFPFHRKLSTVPIGMISLVEKALEETTETLTSIITGDTVATFTKAAPLVSETASFYIGSSKKSSGMGSDGGPVSLSRLELTEDERKDYSSESAFYHRSWQKFFNLPLEEQGFGWQFTEYEEIYRAKPHLFDIPDASPT